MTAEPNWTGYRRRLIDTRLEQELALHPAVELVGIAHSGKATAAQAYAASTCDLAFDSDARDATRADPTLVIAGPEPRAILDCQTVPVLGPAAGSYAEALATAGTKGALILTSSCEETKATQGNLSTLSEASRGSAVIGGSTEDGVGATAVARLRMYPLSLWELGVSDGRASLEGLFHGEQRASRFTDNPANPPRIVGSAEDARSARPAGVGRGTLTTPEVARWCCRGGWPAPRGSDDEACTEAVRSYTGEVLADACASSGLSTATAQALAWSLAAHLGEIPDVSAMASGIEASTGVNPARDTIRTYLRLLETCQLMIPVPGWVPPGRNRAHMRVKPRYYFADPSIPAALLSDTPEGLLTRYQRLEKLLENLVLRDLLVYLEATGGGARVSYYQESAGLTATFIIERGARPDAGGAGESDYRWGAVSVCLSDAEADAVAKDLLKVRKRAKASAPGFLAIITGRGSYPIKRDDGVFVIPIASLGA